MPGVYHGFLCARISYCLYIAEVIVFVDHCFLPALVQGTAPTPNDIDRNVMVTAALRTNFLIVPPVNQLFGLAAHQGTKLTIACECILHSSMVKLVRNNSRGKQQAVLHKEESAFFTHGAKRSQHFLSNPWALKLSLLSCL